jgi:hypothetical protein
MAVNSRIGEIMDIRLNDVLELKKPHPCGGKQWLVLRVGMDFRLRCTTCGHELMSPRRNIEKSVRKVIREEPGE